MEPRNLGRNWNMLKERLQGLTEKRVILEEQQESEIGEQADQEILLPFRRSACFFHLKTGEIVDEGDRDQDEEIFRLGQHVKEVAGSQQEDPAVPRRKTEIDDDNKGEKE